MYKIKKYIVAVGVMLLASVVSLVVVSAASYLFKWQADKAMIGIIVSYVLAGLSGGCFLGRKKRKEKMRRKEIGKKMIEALIVTCVFLSFLILFSGIAFQIPFVLSKRFIMIGLLILSSSFVGQCV